MPVEEIEQLIQARRAARAARNFAEADRIRKDLEARGILLEDTAAGTRWKTEVMHMNAPDIKTPLPGPKAKAIIDKDAKFVSPSYTRDYPLVIARGEGAVVEDVDGNVFLDCAAGIAVNSTGVSHPDVVKAIADQAAKFIHMSGTDFYYEPQVRLAEELASLVPIDGDVRTFFGNSGHRGDRGGDQAVALLHEAPEHHRVPRIVPRPLARRAGADRRASRCSAAASGR